MINDNDKIVACSYGSPRLTCRNPFERLPERDSWLEWEIRERADGSRYKVQRWADRWAGSFSYESWVEVDLPPLYELPELYVPRS